MSYSSTYKKSTYEKFKYNDKNGYQDAYKSAKKAYENVGTLESQKGYISNVDELLNNVLNAEDFSYDMNKDKLFQMYKNQYNQQGKTAMQNTMGVATASSGGYNSSAAQTASQSTYQTYMDALSDKTAETYQNAYDLYQDKQDLNLSKYNAALTNNQAISDNYWNNKNSLQTAMQNAWDTYNSDRSYQYTKHNDRQVYDQTNSNNQQTYEQTSYWNKKNYDQTKYWNKKNYNLMKKKYTG